MITIPSGTRNLRVLCQEPSGPAPGDRFPTVLLLHGAGGNVRFWFDRVAPVLARAGFAVYAVHYFDCTGTTRAETAELRDGIHIPLWAGAIRDTLVHMAENPRVDLERIALLGISLGAFLALSLTAEATGSSSATLGLPDPMCLRAVVDISGGLIPPWRAQATPAYPPTLIVHGDQDTVVAVSHAYGLDRLLTSLEVEHELAILPGESHWFTPGAHMRILDLVTSFLTRHMGSAVAVPITQSAARIEPALHP